MQLIATLFNLLDAVVNLYMWCFIVSAILRPIRNMLPNFGGIDFSPLIAILLLIFLKDGVLRQIYIWVAT